MAFVYLRLPYDISGAMERRINGYLCRWLGLPRSLSSATLYGNLNAPKLSFKGSVEEFVVFWIREFLQYKDSKDPKVVTAGIKVCTRRKWSAGRKLDTEEEHLRQKALMGMVASGHAALGFFPGT